ncbi:inactive pancreatic lipase-related protein 1-like [Saccostrea cucullata]|uniref:inactive pancreatic lipase-related protein 1-like n=1 Tax=Saccostrea cuccullata TaxID=36930 RepID=UPI002ED002BD
MTTVDNNQSMTTVDNLKQIIRREKENEIRIHRFHSEGNLKTPQKPSIVNTRFRLYQRAHASHVAETGGGFFAPDVAPFTNHVNATKKIKVLIHGFLNNGKTNWVTRAKDELLVKDDFNVIIVDWGSGAQMPYEQAAGNVYLVGAEVSSMLKHLHDYAHVNYADVHIIGHSLGAQIAGLASHPLPGIGRITGLDPADPLFSGKPVSRRLDPDDATFVDVIHTDATTFVFTKGYGTHDIVGDVDFFPNGGEYQPGCPEKPAGSALSSLLQGAFGSVATSLSCSHGRAHEYFIESINSPCKFYAHQCASLADFDHGRCMACPAGGCAVMGYEADDTSPRGVFFLSTSSHSPYCGHEYDMEIVISHSMNGHSYGEFFVTLIGTKGQSKELKFSRLMQFYFTDTTERHILVAHADIGDFTGVKVRFVRGDGLKALGSEHEVVVRYVTVQSAGMPGGQVKFCGHDAHIQENHVATLHSTLGC